MSQYLEFLRYFIFCLSWFLLWKVSLPVAFNLYYMYSNRIEYHCSTTVEYSTTLCSLLPISQFSWFLLCTASKKLLLSFSRTSCDYQSDFSKFQKIQGKIAFFLEFQECSRTKVIFRDFSIKACGNPVNENWLYCFFQGWYDRKCIVFIFNMQTISLAKFISFQLILASFGEYRIYSAIRRGFPCPDWLQITKSVLWNVAEIRLLPFPNNPKDLDPSLKMDLD